MTQCAYSLDALSWTDFPVGPQLDLEIGIDEQNIELLTDGGKTWTERLFERDDLTLNFKIKAEHLPAFQALHDAVDPNLNRLFVTLDRTADPIVIIYGWKQSGFTLSGTGEPVQPSAFNYRLSISGEQMSILTLIRSYNFADLPANPAAGTLARVSDSPGGLWVYSGIQWVRNTDYINVKDVPYNAVGDGSTGDSASIQSAIDDALEFGLRVYVPATQAGYLIETALDCHDCDHLSIFGDGAKHPAFGLKDVVPSNGSILLGGTGATGCIIDAAGSNGFQFQGITLSTISVADPSRIGIINGTSNRSDPGTPGSAFHKYEDVAIWMTQLGNSIPMYCNNINLSTFRNVTTLGDASVIFESGNPRLITPPYSTFGADIQNDGNVVENLSCLVHGVAPGEPGFWMHKVNNLRGNIYVANMNGGPSYPGFAYAIYSAGCVDIDLKVEIDYFPAALLMEEFHSNVRFSGSTFPNDTPIGIDLAIIAFLNGVRYDNCHWNITPVMGALPNTNFHYTSDGVTPTIAHIKNCSFIFDSVPSGNVLFLNVTADEAVPLWSNRIEGDTDAILNSLLIAGGIMPAPAYRMFLNGLQIGSA